MSPDLPRRPTPDRTPDLLDVVLKLGDALTAIARLYRDLDTTVRDSDAQSAVRATRPPAETGWTSTHVPEAILNPDDLNLDLSLAVEQCDRDGFGPIEAVATDDPRIGAAAADLDLDVIPVRAIPAGPWPKHVLKADASDRTPSRWPPATPIKWSSESPGDTPVVSLIEILPDTDVTGLLRHLITETESRGYGPIVSVVSTNMRVCGAALAIGLHVGADHSPHQTLVVKTTGPDAEPEYVAPPAGWPLVRTGPAETVPDDRREQLEGEARDVATGRSLFDRERPTDHMQYMTNPVPADDAPPPPPPAPPPPPPVDETDTGDPT